MSDALGNDRETLRRYVSSVLYMLVLAMLVLGIAFGAIYGIVPWAELFNLSSAHGAAVAGSAMAVFLAVTIVALPLERRPEHPCRLPRRIREQRLARRGEHRLPCRSRRSDRSQCRLPWLVLALGGGPVLSRSL